jgi:hypothetical protein
VAAHKAQRTTVVVVVAHRKMRRLVLERLIRGITVAHKVAVTVARVVVAQVLLAHSQAGLMVATVEQVFRQASRVHLFLVLAVAVVEAMLRVLTVEQELLAAATVAVTALEMARQVQRTQVAVAVRVAKVVALEVRRLAAQAS